MPKATVPTTTDLSSNQARRALPARSKPYWQICTPGAHLGYYKGNRGGAWYGRKFIGAGKYRQTKLGPSRDDDGKAGSRPDLRRGREGALALGCRRQRRGAEEGKPGRAAQRGGARHPHDRAA
ncbi:hypothetical protein J7E70_18755 [Variovorax paradoxus]|nr:hypothetical protein [Variovorax paradoxus]MBT2302495.1 hypothetical protein [Variovorax paradoxus]